MSNVLVGAKACRPNPVLEPLSFLVGDWSTTGTHPAFPGKELPGTTTFAWAEGGAFLVMRSQTDHPDFPDGLGLFASDDALGTLTMCWFDERGISRLCPVNLGVRSIDWRHDDPAFMQHLKITADPSGDRMTSEGEMAKDGSSWGPDLSQVFVRK